MMAPESMSSNHPRTGPQPFAPQLERVFKMSQTSLIEPSLMNHLESALINRRKFLGGLAACLWAPGKIATDELPPVRAITRGPKFHWFGYYDKLQFDPTGRYALGIRVDFEHRSPRPSDFVEIGMVDLEDGDRWIDLGERSSSWSWHHGCMLQWLPGSKTEIIWNDQLQNRFVSHILNVRTGKKRTLPVPIYAVSAAAGAGDQRPDGSADHQQPLQPVRHDVRAR